MKDKTSQTDLTKTHNLRVGMVHWHKDHTGDGLASLLGQTFAEFGCEIVDFFHNDPIPENLDVVLVHGPFGSLVPLANQVLAFPSTQRPLFVLWMTEQFPNPDLPEWVHYWGGIIRSRAERLAFREETAGKWVLKRRLKWLTSKAHRFRYYGDLYWLQQQGLLAVLVTGSQVTGDFLRSKGFDPVVTSMGAHSSWGTNLKLERDIPVLWIGKTGSERRNRLLKYIRLGLREHGIEMMVVDGVENPYVFGKERTILLNRTKIVLNILREKWDNNAMRYYFAAPNRALIVTEPTLPHTPFIPGKHLVEAKPERIADTISYYFSHQDEREKIVDQAYQLITTELTMHNGVSKVLERIARLSQNKAR